MERKGAFEARRAGAVCALVAMVIAGLAGPAAAVVPPATDVTITDLNATVVFDLTSDAGSKSWVVGGIEHLEKQWFWYRIGDTGPEQSIDTLTLSNWMTSNGDFDDPADERLVVEYTGQDFTITLDFILGGSTTNDGRADMAELITIHNTGTEDMEFHFFQYCDFDLMGTAIDEKVEIVGIGNTAQQFDGPHGVSETVVTPLPDYYRAGVYSEILDLLTDGDADDLGIVPGPKFNEDLTWGFQWDFVVIAAGASEVISKNKTVVPEPTALALLAVGGVMLIVRRRR